MSVLRGLPPQFKSVDECHQAMVRRSRGAAWQATLGVALLYFACQISPWLLGSDSGPFAGDLFALGLLGFGALSMFSGALRSWRKLAELGRQLEGGSGGLKHSYTRREPSLRRY